MDTIKGPCFGTDQKALASVQFKKPLLRYSSKGPCFGIVQKALVSATDQKAHKRMRRIPFLDPQVLTKLPPIALKALRDVEGALAGLHQSPHHGQSIEFTEHKEYSPGDEIRHIDWKLFAKSDRYYVKQFEDETNLRGYILLDASASMNYPQHPKDREQRPTKYHYAASLALALAYLLLRQRDAIGLLAFNSKQQHYLPPKASLLTCSRLPKPSTNPPKKAPRFPKTSDDSPKPPDDAAFCF